MRLQCMHRFGYVAAAILLGCVSASASTLLTPSPTVNTLVVGSHYDTNQISVGGLVTLNVDYLFDVPSEVLSRTVETTFHSIGGDGLAINNAALQWYAWNGSTYATLGPSGFLQVTDSTGTETTLQPTLDLVLTNPPELYELVLTGTTELNGGNYDLSVAASATPLPAGFVLFGSVLVGSGLLARRRKSTLVAAV
jgi:hypothetical protein